MACATCATPAMSPTKGVPDRGRQPLPRAGATGVGGGVTHPARNLRRRSHIDLLVPSLRPAGPVRAADGHRLLHRPRRGGGGAVVDDDDGACLFDGTYLGSTYLEVDDPDLGAFVAGCSAVAVVEGCEIEGLVTCATPAWGHLRRRHPGRHRRLPVRPVERQRGLRAGALIGRASGPVQSGHPAWELASDNVYCWARHSLSQPFAQYSLRDVTAWIRPRLRRLGVLQIQC